MTSIRKRWSDEELAFIKERHLAGADRRVILSELNQKFQMGRELDALSVCISRKLQLPGIYKVRRVLQETPDAENVQELAAKRANQRDIDRNPHLDAEIEISRLALKERKCLRCSRIFLSQHSGNRMCDPCRTEINNMGYY